MNFVGKTLRTGVAAALLLAGNTTGAQGDIGDAGSSFGSPGTDLMRIRAVVVCTGCTLEEVQKVQPSFDLYQLRHRQGNLVLYVRWLSNSTRWHRVVWPPQLWVRGEEHLLQRLTAEANLRVEMAIEGTLSNTRTLDITGITLSG